MPCSLQMCDEPEAVQWVEIASLVGAHEDVKRLKNSRTLYLCEAHTLDTEEFGDFVAEYACDEECPVCNA